MAVSLLLAALLQAEPPPPLDPEVLIREVVRNQRKLEARLAASTYDQREIETTYDGKGRPKGILDRVFYVTTASAGAGGSAEGEEESTRELVFVNGRPATEAEKRDAAEEDEKGRKKRLERRAAAKAKATPKVQGSDDDPLVGTRRLSELLAKYDFALEGEAVEEGRPVYFLRFTPRSGLPTPTLTDKALAALSGTVAIDALDLTVRSVDARIVKPIKVAGGLAANVKGGAIQYEGWPLSPGRWAPCRVELRVTGKTAVFLRLDTSFRFEFGNFRTFAVDVETDEKAPGESNGADSEGETPFPP